MKRNRSGGEVGRLLSGRVAPFGGGGSEGSALSSYSRVEWKFMGRAQRNFRVGSYGEGVTGLQRRWRWFRVLARVPTPPNVSFNERPRPVGGVGGVYLTHARALAQCYQLLRGTGGRRRIGTRRARYRGS